MPTSSGKMIEAAITPKRRNISKRRLAPGSQGTVIFTVTAQRTSDCLQPSGGGRDFVNAAMNLEDPPHGAHSPEPGT